MRKKVDPPKPDEAAEEKDWGAEYAKHEERITKLEAKPEPWWHYALVGVVVIGILFGGAIVEFVRGLINDRFAR